MKRVCLTAGLTLLVALVSVEARAQAGILRGRILDDQGQGLENAKLDMDYLGGVTKHYDVKTNKKGEYTQVGLTPGIYKITASKEGFQSGSTELRVGIGEPTTPPDFKLVPLAKLQKAAGGNQGGDALVAGFKEIIEAVKAARYDEAETKTKDLIAKNPTVPELQYELGYIQSQKKDWAGAEAAYKKTLELKADFTDAISGLAGVYRSTGREADATALIDKAAVDFPQDGKLQFQIGVALLNSGKNEEAVGAFKKALELDPSNAESHYYLGTLAIGQNKKEEAIDYLEKYLASNPAPSQNRQTAEGLLTYLKPKK